MPGSEDSRPVCRHGDRELEMRCKRPVLGVDRPPVVAHPDRVPAGRDHRLDGQDHALQELRTRSRLAEVGDLRVLVHVPADAVADQGADHPEAVLLDTTRAALFDAVEQCRPGNRLGDVSHAVQARVEADGFSVIRSLVGHGIGRAMHEDPQIPNFGEPGTGPELEEGMVLAIEPMVNVGTHHVRMGSDNWAVYSEDGSLAAHFEHTVAITGDGPRILTPWHLAEVEPLQAATLSGRR